MDPPILLARTQQDPLDPTTPSASIQPLSYSCWSSTTYFDPPRFSSHPLRESILPPPTIPQAPNPSNLVDWDPSSLSWGIRFSSFGLWFPTTCFPALIPFGTLVEIPQAAILIGQAIVMPAHPEIMFPFSPSSHPFLVSLTDDTPCLPHHVPSHTLDWLACCPSGQIGCGSQCLHHSLSGFPLPLWVVGPPVSTGK